MSDARRAAEAAMLPFRDGPHLTTKVTAEAVWNLAVAMDALLAETERLRDSLSDVVYLFRLMEREGEIPSNTNEHDYVNRAEALLDSLREKKGTHRV